MVITKPSACYAAKHVSNFNPEENCDGEDSSAVNIPTEYITFKKPVTSDLRQQEILQSKTHLKILLSPKHNKNLTKTQILQVSFKQFPNVFYWLQKSN